jgi:EAL domain-containing protein (putative c-di-GMP-specific phosphodiesterase class I)
VLEVTERESIESVRGVVARAGDLRKMGFRIAVDDLGAGYAGLSAIATLEPDVVKIDMSLVRGIHTSVVRQRTVAAVVGLCRELGSVVVAECIEVRDELACCVDLGVDRVQGYLMGRPGPLPRVLRRWV